ncbi:response regulator [Leptospira ilyithenensis]|uniref:histidine kinase n=1 Tax=Leptospira ilyithenensis TaxID=2484901 RepID=A0A4R9LL45_9LEPT|nr:response regulator [Leptospira ilyithenensis]TGN08325.1 hybrid sensor histidine kinase/response regulator [Leptospira ilyithenensis]
MVTDLVSQTSPKRVLVVEDERIIAINICSTLKQFGYSSEYVSEGQAAIDCVDNELFDLVLMDIMLNGEMDGIEAAKIIKRRKDLPIIYLTAYSDDSTLDRAKSTEPFGYLIKPFNSRDLYISVEMAIYKSRIQKQLKDFQNKLSETQKWETIGLVAASISHDINNPLTSILNLAELIAKETSKTGQKSIQEHARKISSESERIAKIIKNLVSYSQTTSTILTYSDLYQIMLETRSFLHQYFLKEGIQCEIESEKLPLYFCQSQKIKQVFLNLLQDARGRILNNTESTDRKISVQLQWEETEVEKIIKIQIIDNGKIDPSKLIPDQNSLDITRNLIEEHKGKLERKELADGGLWIIKFYLSEKN